MPHVILNGQLSLEDFFSSFTPMVEETQSWLIKIEECFLGRKGSRAIISVVVVEEGHPQTFYMFMTSNNGRLSIRLDPLTDPIKTKGVKRSIGLMAEKVLAHERNLVVDHHNIEDYFNNHVSK